MNLIPEWDKEALLRMLSFVPLHSTISRLGANGFPTLQDCNALLAARQPGITVHSGQSLRFVPQEYGKLPFEAQYEPRCFLKGEVPTRADNWHDLLNALVWLTFPKAKAAINGRHYQALTGQGNDAAARSQRGTVRDTNTLLDESGVIVACADPGLAALLCNFQWKELFWQRREDVQSGMGFYLFGHGLYEKALRPYVGMTGQGLILAVPQAFFGWPLGRRLAHLDGALAAYLAGPDAARARPLDPRELTPVPVLGVPGWSAQSASEFFYADSSYFRPGRLSS